jgi:hypothetical protein
LRKLYTTRRKTKTVCSPFCIYRTYKEIQGSTSTRKIQELTTIPITIKNSFREISCPRIGVEAVSAMYIGAACIA